jgi:hypothetical protein
MTINLWFVFGMFMPISLYDCYKMAKSELPYWMKGGYQEEPSEAASMSQFALWYFFCFLIISIIQYFTAPSIFIGILNVILNVTCIVLLHYAGLEDVLFYAAAMIKGFELPDTYWENRGWDKIFGIRFPRRLEWLARTRKIGWMTIKSKWIPMFAGKDVHIRGLLLSIVIACNIIIALRILI